MNNKDLSFDTLAIHAGSIEHEAFGSLATPIYQTSTFYFDSAEQGGRPSSGCHFLNCDGDTPNRRLNT